MDKQQIISFIGEQLAAGKISREDLAGIAGNGAPMAPHAAYANEVIQDKKDSSKNLINTFYAIGAVIAVIGIGILIAQHWLEIGFGGRILVSLGISLATYVSALLLNKNHQKIVSQVLFTISAALAPLGAYVLLKEANVSFDWAAQIATALILFVVYGTALFISRRNVLVILTIGFATWAYFALMFKIFGSVDYDSNFLKWACMLLGLSYLCIAYGYKNISRTSELSDLKETDSIKGALYGLGTLALLGGGIAVGGLFDLFFIILIFAAFYGSVYLRSRAMLNLGGLFLMAHIIKLTSKYFVGSVGWPIALIAIGFLVIGVGYMTFYLNRKFIPSK